MRLPGVLLLTTALMLSAYLGVCQEDMYAKHGKHSKESMFMVVSAIVRRLVPLFHCFYQSGSIGFVAVTSEQQE